MRWHPTEFAYSQNLVTNGDFETGNFNGWTVTQAATGTNIKVDTPTTGTDHTFGAFFGATGTDFDIISQTFATTPGAFYTLTFSYGPLSIAPGQPPPPFNNGFDVRWNGVSLSTEVSFPNSTYNRALLPPLSRCRPPAPQPRWNSWAAIANLLISSTTFR